MKKIILCFSLVAMSLASCSSDSESTNESNDVLVKKIAFNAVTDEYSEVVQYTYNGNKLIKGVYDDGSEEIYTYDGNLITEIKIVEDGDVTYSETFSYDSNDRLIAYVSQEVGFTESETFVYNSDGTVTSTIGTGGAANIRTLYFDNDELVKIVDASGRTYDYTYDAKNNPFRNVTGFDKIAYVIHGDHEFFGRKQNILTIHETTENVDYMTNTMTYNADNYPLTATSVAMFEFDGLNTATIQYTYY
jgi:hypothetical protein